MMRGVLNLEGSTFHVLSNLLSIWDSQPGIISHASQAIANRVISPPPREPEIPRPPSSAANPVTFFPPPPNTAKPNKHQRRRKKSSYSENFTAALEFPFSMEQIKLFKPAELFENSKLNIIEHASRRVDLFFYTLVAYYNKKVHPKLGHTFLQHGTGRTTSDNQSLTQACHSSFTPALVDDDSDSGMLFGTHFQDSLNTTVELPPYVNELDNEFETIFPCRQNCLSILERVAQAEINPIEGLTKFLKMMARLFADIECNSKLLKRFNSKYGKLSSPLLELVKQGTLEDKFISAEKKVDLAYIESLLRFTEDESLEVQADPSNWQKMCDSKIKEMQSEILNSPSKRQLSG